MGKFHGAGREDVDVRMLGGGRPFVFEVVQPKQFEVDLDELVEAINIYGKGRMEITSLRPVRRKRVAELKETRSDKVYRALVLLEQILPEDRLMELVGEKIVVTQRTPKRVAHRRADLDRTRTVEVLGARSFRGPEAKPSLDLLVRCEHGTYVKEWISGEEGRSRPSLGELLETRTECLVLDVWDICGPFPSEEAKGPEPVFEREIHWEELLEGDDPWDLERLADASPKGVTERRAEAAEEKEQPKKEQSSENGNESIPS
jgi:tRNA pseudouridine synthase 10